ncbi:hypothetical protein HAX54_022781, partial [Datura stramonium]|nr:hypothetical protein [Datura stramonium]
DFGVLQDTTLKVNNNIGKFMALGKYFISKKVFKGGVVDSSTLTKPGVFEELKVLVRDVKPEIRKKLFDKRTLEDARILSLESDNAQLNTTLEFTNREITFLKEKILEQQHVHNGRIYKLLALIEKST